MNDMQLLGVIGVAIRPAKNVRVHFIREPFDHSLTSHTPSEVDEKLLPPTFEYVLTLCDKGWMCLETMEGGAYKNNKEGRDIRRLFYSYGAYFVRPKKKVRPGPIDVRSGGGGGTGGLSDFWAEFMGYNIYHFDNSGNRWNSISINESEGFYSVVRDDVRYLSDRREGARVVRAQYLFPDGRVDFESIHEIKHFPNGVWFQMGYDMMRYADPETGRDARFHRCVRVTDIEFDVEFDAKTFELPEGVDAVTRAT